MQSAKEKRPKEKLLKKKTKNIKERKEIGGAVVVRPSYFDCIGLRVKTDGHFRQGADTSSKSSEDQISNSEFSKNLSFSDSDVIRCNSRIIKNHNSGIGRSVWNSISKMGVVSCKDDKTNIKLLEEMEIRDKVGMVHWRRF